MSVIKVYLNVLTSGGRNSTQWSRHLIQMTGQLHAQADLTWVICYKAGSEPQGQSRHDGILRLKCDGTRAQTRFRLSAKRTSPFKSDGVSVQSTTGSRGVHISGSNAGYTMFRDSVKSTCYPLHSPVSSSLPHPGVTVCRHVSNGL